MKYHVTVGGREYLIEVSGTEVMVDGQTVEADLTPLGPPGLYGLGVGASRHAIHATRRPDSTWTIHVDGQSHDARAVSERTHAIEQMTTAARANQGPRPVRATMPGLVVSVNVTAGEAVTAGQGVVIVEAMKMENQLAALADGVVAQVHVAAGDTVEKDQTLIEFEAPEGNRDASA